MPVEAARAAMVSAAVPLAAQCVVLEEARGRVLAEAVIAMRDTPPFDVSSMDGYAIRAADHPRTLVLLGESAAGHGFDGVLAPGGAIRISTGAAVPAGADAVVMQENVTRDGDAVSVPATARGANIRPRGGDFHADETLLEAGRRLDGVALALAAAAGRAELSVRRAPRIALLSSGDELAAPDQTPGSYQIYDSATYGIAALARGWGAHVQRLDIARDDIDAIADAAARGLEESDLLVVLGGASVGDHDHARPALERLGLDMACASVAVRPGKPTWFGTTPYGPVLGLPGNPASALVCAHLFLKPLIERMLGSAGTLSFTRARLVHALPANGPREHYLRSAVTMGDDGVQTARAFENQDSSLLSVFAAANALIRLPPDAPALAPGALVDVLALNAP
ncbi:MAG: molybdopterin molybdotransferase MoeA [Alphaproteobacteria bacterium]|nr:molybdopterin molybdotransferase MoeA [Alphaproteobacteria bacterium]